MSNQQKQAKVSLMGVNKRFNLPQTFQEFKQNCKMAFTLKEVDFDNILMNYTDDEDDKVIISNEFDYDQALLFLQNQNQGFLKINLELKNIHNSSLAESIRQSVVIESINYENSEIKTNLKPEDVIGEMFQASFTSNSDPIRSAMCFDGKDFEIINRKEGEEQISPREKNEIIENHIYNKDDNPQKIQIESQAQESQEKHEEKKSSKSLLQIEDQNKINEEIENEKRRQKILDKIRQKAYEDLIKSEPEKNEINYQLNNLKISDKSELENEIDKLNTQLTNELTKYNKPDIEEEARKLIEEININEKTPLIQ